MKRHLGDRQSTSQCRACQTGVSSTFWFCGQQTASDLSSYRNLNHQGWAIWFQNVSDPETFSKETYWFSQDPGISVSLKRGVKPLPLIKEALLGVLFGCLHLCLVTRVSMSLNVVMSLCDPEYLSVLERSGDGLSESPFDPLSPHPISLRVPRSREHETLLQCACIYHLPNIPACTSAFYHHFLPILLWDIAGTLSDILIVRLMLFQHSLHQNAHTDACHLKCPFPLGFPLGHIAFDLSHNHNLCGSVCEPQPGWCTEKDFTFPVIYYSHLLCTWSLWSSVYFTGSNWTCGLLRNIYVRNSTHIPTSQEINEIVSLVLALLWRTHLSWTSFCLLPDPDLPVLDALLRGCVENDDVYLLFLPSLGKKRECRVHNPWVFSSMAWFLLGTVIADWLSNHPD